MIGSYALEARCLRVVKSARGRAQVDVALKYCELAKKRLGVLSRELELAIIRSDVKVGDARSKRIQSLMAHVRWVQ